MVLAMACAPVDNGRAGLGGMDTDAAPMTGVQVHLGVADGAVLELAGAWVEADGDGRGEQARLASASGLVVTGDRSQWNLKDGTAVFEGSVRAVRGALVLTADRAELTVAPDGRVARASASGRVTVVREARQATAARAELDVAAGIVQLTGKPRVSEGSTTITGERIWLYVDDQRVECERCRWEAVTP
jgi:lipopolysaccharide transport protein LptA